MSYVYVVEVEIITGVRTDSKLADSDGCLARKVLCKLACAESVVLMLCLENTVNENVSAAACEVVNCGVVRHVVVYEEVLVELVGAGITPRSTRGGVSCDKLLLKVLGTQRLTVLNVSTCVSLVRCIILDDDVLVLALFVRKSYSIKLNRAVLVGCTKIAVSGLVINYIACFGICNEISSTSAISTPSAFNAGCKAEIAVNMEPFNTKYTKAFATLKERMEYNERQFKAGNMGGGAYSDPNAQQNDRQMGGDASNCLSFCATWCCMDLMCTMCCR